MRVLMYGAFTVLFFSLLGFMMLSDEGASLPTVQRQPAFAPQVGGATYHVAPSGSDSNPGTEARPFRTLQKAADVVNPGDTVIAEDGVYTNSSTSCASSVVCINRGGSSDNWVVFKSRSRWGAKVDGQNNSVAEGFTFRNGVGFVRVEGFEVFGMGNASGSASGFDVYAGGHDVQIVGNRIHHIGRLCADTTNGNVGIFIQRNDVTVEGNLIHDIGRFAPGEGGCNISTTLYQTLDHGIYLNGNSSDSSRRASGATIYNNIFYNNHRGWSVQVYPGKLSNISIINNTFATPSPYKNGQIVISRVTLSDSRIENNIFYNPRNVAITIGTNADFTDVSMRNNITTAGAMLDAVVTNVSSGNNRTSLDPMLVNPSDFDFHLRNGSPGIDAGLPMSEVDKDFDGRKRPQGSGQDIGAFEFPAAVTTPKITRAEVTGKKLYIFGEEFKPGAVLVLNGQGQKTANQDSTSELKCKKAGKKISPGETVILVVRNPDGIESEPFSFTRPANYDQDPGIAAKAVRFPGDVVVVFEIGC